MLNHDQLGLNERQFRAIEEFSGGPASECEFSLAELAVADLALFAADLSRSSLQAQADDERLLRKTSDPDDWPDTNAGDQLEQLEALISAFQSGVRPEPILVAFYSEDGGGIEELLDGALVFAAAREAGLVTVPALLCIS
jgi:hypothetical protein